MPGSTRSWKECRGYEGKNVLLIFRGRGGGGEGLGGSGGTDSHIKRTGVLVVTI